MNTINQCTLTSVELGSNSKDFALVKKSNNLRIIKLYWFSVYRFVLLKKESGTLFIIFQYL